MAIRRQACYGLIVLMTSSLLMSAKGISAATDSEKTNALSGSYLGKLKSGGRLLKVVTRIKVTPKGHITGSYQFSERGQDQCGLLVNCQFLRSHKLECRWQDRYGSGPLIVVFATDTNSFAGYWISRGSSQKFLWNGQRTKALPRSPCSFGLES